MNINTLLILTFMTEVFIAPLASFASETPSVPNTPAVSDEIRPPSTISGKGHRQAAKLNIITMVNSSQRETKEIRGSLCTEKISFLPEGKGYKVQKFYKNEGCYKKEFLTFEADKKIISEYNKKRDSFLKKDPTIKLPILVKILDYGTIEHEGQPIYIQYMDAAQGETVRKLIEDISSGVKSSQEDIHKIFHYIGVSFGNIHRMLNDNQESKLQGFNHLVHPDPNAGNFLYDQTTDQLYWIDLSGIKFERYKEAEGFKDNSELNTYFFTREMLQSIIKLIAEAKSKNTPQEKIEWINRAVNIIYAHQAIFQGYKSVVGQYKKNNLTIKLVFALNTRSSTTNYVQFQNYLDKLQKAYKEITEEDITLLKGYD